MYLGQPQPYDLFIQLTISLLRGFSCHSLITPAESHLYQSYRVMVLSPILNPQTSILSPQSSDLSSQSSVLRPQTSNLRPQTSVLSHQSSDLRPQTSDFRPLTHQPTRWLLAIKVSFVGIFLSAPDETRPWTSGRSDSGDNGTVKL